MLTNNFINLSKIVMLGNRYDRTCSIKGRNVSGEERYFVPVNSAAYPSTDSMNSFNASPTSSGWSVGTGNTPATVNDYQLESTITSNISGSVTVSPINDTTLNRVIKRVSVIVTNTGGNNISINEIGFKASIYSNTGVNQIGQNSVYLLYREVLSVPVTLTPGESTSFVIDFYVTTE